MIGAILQVCIAADEFKQAKQERGTCEFLLSQEWSDVVAQKCERARNRVLEARSMLLARLLQLPDPDRHLRTRR